MPCVMQITKIRLHPKADESLSAKAYREVEAWLQQWTARGNFKAVYAETEKEALAILSKDLSQTLVPSWYAHHGVKPGHFQFEVSSQKVEDGRFWMPSAVVWAHWYDIPGDCDENTVL